jgi:hypothetical protein
MNKDIILAVAGAAVSGFGSLLAGFGISKYADKKYTAPDPSDKDQVAELKKKKQRFTIVASCLSSAVIDTGVSVATISIMNNYNGSEDNSSDASSNRDASDTDTSELR